MLLDALSYTANALIIITYGFVRSRPRWFDWANLLGAPFIMAVEIKAQVWPVMPVTVFFGLIAAWHLWRDRRG